MGSSLSSGLKFNKHSLNASYVLDITPAPSMLEAASVYSENSMF